MLAPQHEFKVSRNALRYGWASFGTVYFHLSLGNIQYKKTLSAENRRTFLFDKKPCG